MPPEDIQGLVNSATRTARVAFTEAMAALPAEEFMRVVLTAQSDGASHDYSWLGDVPLVREWLDERTLALLTAHAFLIVNRRWESTVRVPLQAFRSNNLNLVRARVADLTDNGKRHVFELISALLVGGDTGLCFDGTAFFAGDHAFAESGVWDNLLDGTGITTATVLTDWATAKAAMRKFPDSRGRPINRVPDTAWVPAELEGIFLEAFKATQVAGTTNVYQGQATVIVDPNLDDATDWYALCSGAPMKPFVWQRNQDWLFKAVTNVEDSWVFLNDAVLYGGDGYYNAGYALPQLAVKTVNANGE